MLLFKEISPELNQLQVCFHPQLSITVTLPINTIFTDDDLNK